jgi:hypothetical protein
MIRPVPGTSIVPDASCSAETITLNSGLPLKSKPIFSMYPSQKVVPLVLVWAMPTKGVSKLRIMAKSLDFMDIKIKRIP